MKNILKLVYKDFKIAVHPTAIVYFVLAGAMFFIPNYPRYIGPLYMFIAVFIMFSADLQYKDREFCGILPVSKADCVKARMITVTILEIGVILVSAVCAYFGNMVFDSTPELSENLAGMESNLTIFAAVLVGYAFSNLIIVTAGYKKSQVRAKDLFAILAYMAVCGIAEGLASVIEFLGQDTMEAIIKQIPILIAAIGFYVVLNMITCKIAIKDFMKAEI